jgi:hypothetical protein
MKWAAVAVVLAIGACLGMYFGLRGSSVPEVSKGQQSAILEQAKKQGVITAYRVQGSGYEVAGGQIRLRSGRGLCAGEAVELCLPVFIEYRRPAERQAEAIYRIARSHLPSVIVKLFEITPGIAESHIPDARIMLIPKAGA